MPADRRLGSLVVCGMPALLLVFSLAASAEEGGNGQAARKNASAKPYRAVVAPMGVNSVPVVSQLDKPIGLLNTDAIVSPKADAPAPTEAPKNSAVPPQAVDEGGGDWFFAAVFLGLLLLLGFGLSFLTSRKES